MFQVGCTSQLRNKGEKSKKPPPSLTLPLRLVCLLPRWLGGKERVTVVTFDTK